MPNAIPSGQLIKLLHDRLEKQAATLGSKIEKIQNQRVDVRSIEKIVPSAS